jgi:hypothetical protein
MTILGIDPGAHGAIAVLDEGGDLLEVLDTPSTLETNGRSATNAPLLADTRGPQRPDGSSPTSGISWRRQSGFPASKTKERANEGRLRPVATHTKSADSDSADDGAHC